MSVIEDVADFGTPATSKSVDLEDAVLSPIYVLAAASATGVASVSVLGNSMSDVVTTAAGFDITLAFLLSVAAVGLAYATNEITIDKIMGMETQYRAAAVGSAAIPAVFEFSNYFSTLASSNDIVGIVALVASAAGFYIISYL